MSGINPQQLSQPWQQQSEYYQSGVQQQPPQQIQQHSGQEGQPPVVDNNYGPPTVGNAPVFAIPDGNMNQRGPVQSQNALVGGPPLGGGPLPSMQQTMMPQAYGIPSQQRQYGQPPVVDNHYGPPPVGNAPVFATPDGNMNQRGPVQSQNAWVVPSNQRGGPPPLNAFVGGPPLGNFHGEQRGGYGMDNRRSWESQDRSTGGGRPPYNRGPGDYGIPGGQAGYRGGYDRDRRSGGGYSARNERRGGNADGDRDGRSGPQQFQSKNILFFSGLPQNVNEQFIHDVFSMEQGDIEANSDGSPRIKIYKDAGQSKGECTINFRNEEIAQRVLNTYNGQPFPGSDSNIMSISFAKFSGGKGGGGRPPQRGYGGNNERSDRQGRGGFGGGFERGPPTRRDYGESNRGRSEGFSRGGQGGFSDGGGRGDRSAGRKGGLEMRKGDWTCACGNINFAFRRECNSCKAPKPQGSSEGYQAFGNSRGGGGPMRSRGGRFNGGERSRPY